MLQSFVRIAGLAGFTACGLLAVSVGAKAVSAPLNHSAQDPLWFWAFMITCAAAPPLALIARGRLLIVLSLSAVAVFILSTIIHGGAGMAFLVLGWLIMVAAVLGGSFLGIVAPSLSATKFERKILAVTCGLGLLALLMLFAGSLHLYYTLAAYALLAALTLLHLPHLMRSVRSALTRVLPRAVEAWHTSDLRLPAIFLASLAICLWGGLVWAVVPSIHFDALVYHLGIPAIYVQQHGIVEVTEEFRSYWAHNGEMLYTLGLLLTGQPLPTLIHLCSGVLIAGWVAAVGKRIGGARLGIIAAMLFYSVPLVTLQSGCAYIDLFVALFATGALGSAIIWWLEQDSRWLIISGVLAGFAAGTKLSAAYVLGPLLLSILCALYLRHRLRKPFFLGLLGMGMPLLLGYAPWLIRDWTWTGNPIFPFYNLVFESSKWPRENPLFDFTHHGVGRGIFDFMRLPWDLLRGDAFLETGLGVMGGLSLFALPWGFFSAQRSLRRWLLVLSVFCTIGLSAWFQVGQYARYLLPLVPVFALLSAMNLEPLLSWIGTRSWKAAATALLTVLGIAYLASTRWVVTRSNWYIPERYPYAVSLGWTDRQAFLSRAVDVYDAFQFLNTRGRPEVLSIGNSYRLYTNARIIPVGSPVEPKGRIPPVAAGPSLANELNRRKFDYILINRSAVRLSPQEYSGVGILDPVFLGKYFDLAYGGRDVSLYSWRQFDAEAFTARAGNLLRNEGFEELDPNGNCVGWISGSRPLIDRTGAKAHSGQAAVQVDAAVILYQPLSVSPRLTYTVGHWSRADARGQLARLQVNWLDDNLKIITASIEVVPVGAEWEWHQMTLQAPEGAALAQVYACVHENCRVWFDDIHFFQAAVK